MKHKKLFITAITIFSVVVFLAILIVLWYWGDSYSDFADFNTIKTLSGDSLDIPGLDDGAVPQGMANYTTTYTFTDDGGIEQTIKQEYLFISAYMKEGPSRIYVTGTKTGYVGYVTLKNEDGTDYFGHAGGIATSCNNSDSAGNKTQEKNGTLWIVSDGTVYCTKKSSDEYYNIAEEVIAKAGLTEGDKTIRFTSSFKANNRASFCFFYEDGTVSVLNDKLYVGEFYHPKKDAYSTADDHRVTTLGGDKHNAFVYEYSSTMDLTNPYGLGLITTSDVPTENRVPKIGKIISVPDKIQGFAITKSKKLILSESYGLANSHLYYYDWSAVTETSSTNRVYYKKLMEDTLGKETNFTYEGVYYTQRGEQEPVPYTDSSLYVYFADESKLLRDYSIPSMSEGMCVNGDRVYVLFESGCYKYKTFVRQKITTVNYFTPRV